MFGKGTFKSSGSFRPGASVTANNRVTLNEKEISAFNEAEKAAANGIEAVKAVQLYNQFLQEANNTDEGTHLLYTSISLHHAIVEVQKLKELAIIKAAQLIKNTGDFVALAAFIRSLNSLWTVFPRAKTAKLVKSLLELFEEIGGESALLTEIELCRELLTWSEVEKRGFLKQALETRLIALFHRTGQYSEALSLVSDVLRQLKKLDDKAALIEVHLLESKIYFALKNVAKARAALTAARTFANSMYTAPIIQAALDMQAGLLHGEEMDFKTAYSYFIECLDNYVNAQHDPRGAQAFKYLLLCKIMMEQAEEVEVIINGKLGQHYPMCRSFEAMQAVAQSCIEKSLKSFEQVLQTYPKGNWCIIAIYCINLSLYLTQYTYIYQIYRTR